jgi:hypothetical protein
MTEPAAIDVTLTRVALIPIAVAISVANAASNAACTVGLEVIAVKSPGTVMMTTSGGEQTWLTNGRERDVKLHTHVLTTIYGA